MIKHTSLAVNNQLMVVDIDICLHDRPQICEHIELFELYSSYLP